MKCCHIHLTIVQRSQKKKRIGPNLNKSSTELSDISLLPTKSIKWGTDQNFGLKKSRKKGELSLTCDSAKKFIFIWYPVPFLLLDNIFSWMWHSYTELTKMQIPRARCTLCTWFVFVLDVYVLYTQVTPFFFLIYSYYLLKKKKIPRARQSWKSFWYATVQLKKSDEKWKKYA